MIVLQSETRQTSNTEYALQNQNQLPTKSEQFRSLAVTQLQLPQPQKQLPAVCEKLLPATIEQPPYSADIDKEKLSLLDIIIFNLCFLVIKLELCILTFMFLVLLLMIEGAILLACIALKIILYTL